MFDLYESHNKIESLLNRLIDTSERPPWAEAELKDIFDEIYQRLTERMDHMNKKFGKILQNNSDARKILDNVLLEHEMIQTSLLNLRERPINSKGWLDDLHKLRDLFESHARRTEQKTLPELNNLLKVNSN